MITDSGNDIKLQVKIGYLPEHDDLRKLVDAINQYVDGYACINTIRTTVNRQNGGDSQTPFFENFHRAGISGVAIREYALDTITTLRQILDDKEETDGRRAIFGMGGVSQPQDVERFLSSGCDVVQASTILLQHHDFPARVRRHLAGQNQPHVVNVATVGDFLAKLKDGSLSRQEQEYVIKKVAELDPKRGH